MAVLVIGAALGIPVAVVAYFFLKLVGEAQQFLFTDLPTDLGFQGEPRWWPVPLLVLCGFVVALTIRHLPGTAGHEPAEGFKAAGAVRPIDLPGIVIASFATLSLGAVLGPEAPLIAIGSGLGVLAMHLIKKDAPKQAVAIIAAAASFAAISTLIGGSPLAGAFLLMEASGIGGAMMGVVLVPGLLAAGMGALIFIGLDSLTGFGRFSLSIPDIPTFTTPTVAEFFWAIAIGVAAAVVGVAIKRLALALQPAVARRRTMLTPLLGLIIGVLAIVFAEGSGKSSSEVLFSGQSALPSLIQNAAEWTVGALVLLVLCKSLAYAGLAERLPRWSHVPGDVHRRGGRDRPVASARSPDDRRGGHGHRSHVGGDVGPAADRGPVHGHLPLGRRRRTHAARDRRGRRGVRCERTSSACSNPSSIG